VWFLAGECGESVRPKPASLAQQIPFGWLQSVLINPSVGLVRVGSIRLDRMVEPDRNRPNRTKPNQLEGRTEPTRLAPHAHCHHRHTTLKTAALRYNVLTFNCRTNVQLRLESTCQILSALTRRCDWKLTPLFKKLRVFQLL